MWAKNPHEVHFGHWRIGQHGQRVQSFACVHDGRIGFYQDFHWQRINQCYPTRGACHVQVSKSDTFAIFSIPFNKLSERSANITNRPDLWSGSSRLEGFVVPKMPVFGLFWSRKNWGIIGWQISCFALVPPDCFWILSDNCFTSSLEGTQPLMSWPCLEHFFVATTCTILKRKLKINGLF